MDKHQRFKRRLMQLHEDITGALAFYAAWHSLVMHDPNAAQWSLERQSQILGRWRGFMTPAVLALQRMAMLSFAKVFDTDSRAASFPSLLREAERDKSLIPHGGPDALSEIDQRLAQARDTRRIITRLRNERLAHTDSSSGELPSLMSQTVESLADDIKFAFNKLSVAHDRSYQDWDSMLRETERDTRDLFRLLANEIDRREVEFDETMVEIGLGHIRETEGILGRRLDENETREAIRSLGLTQAQVERVLHLNRADMTDQPA
jgi:hypothetical protein